MDYDPKKLISESFKIMVLVMKNVVQFFLVGF